MILVRKSGLELMSIDQISRIINVEDVDRKKCTGCKMCADICPKSAITFDYDNEGFWFPHVDGEECINCKKCACSCPAINSSAIFNSAQNMKCYGLWNKADDIRWQSTSGGFFTALANHLLSQEWYVSGAIYDSQMRVKHIVTNKLARIAELRQSKYAQSDTEKIYARIKDLLNQDKKVFFCGTPCQVEALYFLLGRRHENLLTMDFICCGISSPVVFERYLQWQEKRYRSKVTKVWFKNKSAGWSSIGTQVSFANGKQYFRTGNREPYMISFVTDGNNIRNSCFQCKYRHVPHVGDFTAGDFWGIGTIYPEYDDNKGITALMINTDAGYDAFTNIKDQLNEFSCSIDAIAAGNFTIYKPKMPREDRHAFLCCVKALGFIKAIRKYSSYSGKNRMRINFTHYRKNFRSMVKMLLSHVAGVAPEK